MTPFSLILNLLTHYFHKILNPIGSKFVSRAEPGAMSYLAMHKVMCVWNTIPLNVIYHGEDICDTCVNIIKHMPIVFLFRHVHSLAPQTRNSG